MIILAHDGSLYGDWVARYALHFAIGEQDKKLLILHVPDRNTGQDIVTAKFSQLTVAGETLGVEVIPQLLPHGDNVYRSLSQAIPPIPDALLICGTRVKQKKQGLLRGSVAEQLLRTHRCPVLALRVVQPGLLGTPQNLLLPLAGHLGGFCRIWPVFRRLAPHLRRVHLFRALYVHHLRQAHLSPDRERMLLAIGQEYLAKINKELNELYSCDGLNIEQLTSISSDWPNAVLVQASRLRAQMILLGVSERSLAHRILHGAGLEQVLRESPCDVGIYRGP